MKNIAGKVVFITGAANGIGFGMAEAFAAKRARLVLADIDKAALDVAVNALEPTGVDLMAITLDVASADSWADAAVAVQAQFGDVDILCNNAGIGSAKSAQNGPTGFADIPPHIWRQVMDVNVDSVYHGVRAFVPAMIARGKGGHIVNTASMAGFLAPAGLGLYSATKFAVVGLSEALAAELLPAGIGVSILCPGGVRSKFVERSAERSAAAANQPFSPPVQPIKMNARNVGDMVVTAIEEGKLYVFTHPEYETLVRDRLETVLASFGASGEPGYTDTPAMLAASGSPIYEDQKTRLPKL